MISAKPSLHVTVDTAYTPFVIRTSGNSHDSGVLEATQTYDVESSPIVHLPSEDEDEDEDEEMHSKLASCLCMLQSAETH